MNRLYYAYIIIFGILLFSSCKKSTLDPFNAPAQLYFNDEERFTGVLRDSVLISFARLALGTTDTTLHIPLAYIGEVSTTDRPYQVVIDQSKTTAVEGKHYKLLPTAYHVAAGSSQANLPIQVFSTSDLDDKTVQIVLKLVKNENFDINLTKLNADQTKINLSSYRIYLSNMILQPNWWSGYASTFLGNFSRKKIELIQEISGKNLDDLDAAVSKYDWDLLKVVAREVQIHINYMRSTGNELLDEHNQVINMGTYVN